MSNKVLTESSPYMRNTYTIKEVEGIEKYYLNNKEITKEFYDSEMKRLEDKYGEKRIIVPSK